MRKLNALKNVAHELSTRYNLVDSPQDAVLSSLRARTASLSARYSALASAASALASAHARAAEASDALAAHLAAGGAGADAAAAADALREAADASRRAAAAPAAYAAHARRVANVDVVAVVEGEGGVVAVGRRKSEVDSEKARAERAERRIGGGSANAGGGAGASGRDVAGVALALTSGRAAESALETYLAERETLRGRVDAVESSVRERERRELERLTVGVARGNANANASGRYRENEARGSSLVPAEVGDGSVDWLELADDLRLAVSLKRADAVIRGIYPACAEVQPAVLPRCQMRYMTLHAPGEGAVEASQFYTDSEVGWVDDSGAAAARGSGVEGVQYVVAKGTNFKNLKHVMLDLNYALLRDAELRISLHKGFAEAGRELYEHVVDVLEKEKPVRLVGHSMGGAAVCICALLLERDGFTIDYVHAYGSPMFTDATGASVVNSLLGTKLLRIAQYEDVVRTFPPQTRGGFQHCGRVVILHEDDSVWYFADSPAIEPAQGVSVSSSKGFNIHRTSQYSLAVGRQIARIFGTKGAPTEAAMAAAVADADSAARVSASIGDDAGVIERFASRDVSTVGASSNTISSGTEVEAGRLYPQNSTRFGSRSDDYAAGNEGFDRASDADAHISMYHPG